jgi:hypothetical protein
MGRSDGAQRWQRRWRRSDGDGGAAMAMAAQRRLRWRSDGNGNGGAAMGVAVVAAAVAVVHRPPLFVCGSSAAPDGRPPPTAAPHDALLSSPLTSGMYLPILHIFNVGIPYTRTDTGRTDDSLIFSSIDMYDKLKLKNDATYKGINRDFLRNFCLFNRPSTP